MKIDRNMSLGELAERMGDCATVDDADVMRALLVESPYGDTRHVPEREWSQLLAQVSQREREWRRLLDQVSQREREWRRLLDQVSQREREWRRLLAQISQRDRDPDPDSELETNAYPDGFGPDSAAYATDGPRDQTIAELRRIVRACAAHGTDDAAALANEAAIYLAWLEDHHSCRDMPTDWEPGTADDSA